MGFTSDTDDTAVRFDLLREYMAENVLAPERSFVCTSAEQCRLSALVDHRTGRCRPNRLFAVGQLSHVGKHYDLCKDGRPLRILVIAMDTGGTNERVTLEMRRDEVARSAALAYSARNPHMRGTTNALRLAIGRELGEDRGGEMITLLGEPASVHLFDCYAMANLRLCSATETGSVESKGTPTMSVNCLRHLAATVEILEPTLCIIQGVRIADDIEPTARRRERIFEYPQRGKPVGYLDRVTLAGVDTLLAAFTHPSYPRRDWHWGHVRSVPYLWDVVQPTIRRARQELGFP